MRRVWGLLFLAALACHGPTSPNDPASQQPHGRLAGTVKIGPNCPVEQPGNPCPTPPSAYSLRKVLIYDEQKTRLLFTVDIDSQGLYFIDLLPGRYLVDLKRAGLDHSSDVPKVVDIRANVITALDISIDTGLR
jgi:hypothetical protein